MLAAIPGAGSSKLSLTLSVDEETTFSFDDDTSSTLPPVLTLTIRDVEHAKPVGTILLDIRGANQLLGDLVIKTAGLAIKTQRFLDSQ